jgi:RNA polymerase sigma factor (TIGR02999 family)
MSVTSTSESLTELLLEWRAGNSNALEKLAPLVFDELHRIAHRYMQRERDGHTLQTTALVNEAYVRLVGEKKIEWQDRSHFFAVMARVMRHVLTDHARRRSFAKHGGGTRQVSLPETDLMSLERAKELVELDEAMSQLATIDPRKNQVVELRYFGGLSLEETAEVLGVSVMTVRRDWRAAKAWLFRELKK